jgi:signal transduction histidine kinase
MASERALKAGIALCVAALLALALWAGAHLDSPRRVVLSLLLGGVPAGALGASLARLSPRVGQRLGAAGPVLSREQRALVDAAMALEARLEHAPVALFRIEQLSGAGAVSALNGNARRVLAPGRASDPADLFRQLQAQTVDQRNLIGFDTERGVERALVAVAALTLSGQAQRLVALMPVESELEAEALNAWRQLVHVLTHEIMNSLTPVASLSRTAFDLLDELRAALPADVGADLATALDAISRRAASLVEFVGSYRSLANVAPARPERIRLGDLFSRLGALVGGAWRARGGRAEFTLEPSTLELVIDPGQLEQALINLLKNAFEATAACAHAEVQVSARLARGGRLRIEVVDNGPGVPEAQIGHIFTPFYSTKKQGGGIGLAMVRHLIHANGGTVRYVKSLTPGAHFVVTF